MVKAFLKSLDANFVGAPNVQAMNKQLPASALEHMGLVVSSGFGSDANQFARRTANGVEKLVKLVSDGRRSPTGGGSFFDPFASNP